MRIRKPTLQKIKRLLDPRVAKVLSYMRRTGASLSKAAHRERIKPDTLVKKAGRPYTDPDLVSLGKCGAKIISGFE